MSSITATDGSGTSVPLTVLSPWETSWDGRNVITRLLGGDIAVSIVPPDPRSGEYDALFMTEAEAFQCAELHRHPTTFILEDEDRPYVGMTYVLGETLRVALDPDTADLWVVTIGYYEVLS